MHRRQIASRLNTVLSVTTDVQPTGLFDPYKFKSFCDKLRIDTKELGRIKFKLMGPQRYVVSEIAAGLAQGIHTFVILKGRQLGVSTVMLALDMYWMAKFRGLQGAIVTDTDENREIFRSYVTQYIESLPPNAYPTIAAHNRTQLILGAPSASRLVYMVAGEKKKGNLGRAKAVNYLHATECSSWGDEEGYNSLTNTLAQINPSRLYVYESTARGYNMFYQHCETAKESKTQRFIFVGWWRNEFYQKNRNSAEFKTYWDGALTSDEKQWVGEVYERYNINITPEQIAWWRWYVTEQMQGDEQMALQEMPPTEEYAFQLSGSKFFDGERVNQSYQRAVKQECLYYRYQFGQQFEDTEFIETNEENAEVTIWELPNPKGVYVQGADPAYGSSEWADEFAVTGARCYADKIEQAYEVGTVDWTEQQFAWVLMHLAGWYGNTMIALEMQGPGTTVYNEMNNLKQRAGSLKQGDARAGAFDVIGRVRDYLWKKQDSMLGNFAYQWQTNSREKVRLFSTLRSYWTRDMIVVNSPHCSQQFRNIHRNGDQIGGEGRAKDDRVMALGIAVIAWNDWIMKEMQVSNRTYTLENLPEEAKRLVTPVETMVMKFLTKQKIKMPGVNS